MKDPFFVFKGDKYDVGSSFYQAAIPVLSNEACREKSDFDSHYYLVNEGMLCAGYDDGGVDACNVSTSKAYADAHAHHLKKV